jgi:hypothetical protein
MYPALGPYSPFSCFLATIHLVYRLTTGLAQRRRDAEKNRKSFSLRLCAKKILQNKELPLYVLDSDFFKELLVIKLSTPYTYNIVTTTAKKEEQ